MKIWAHTMVKNEGRWLWYSVKSAIDYVDHMLLWDTGSTDETKKICHDLYKQYPGKVGFKEVDQETEKSFANVRQLMLDATDSDWILMLDGDEIWWKDSITKVVETIKSKGDRYESVVVPTVNVVGDIFHYQDASAGRYKFGSRMGHYNLRAVKKSIPGLKSFGEHGVWGWADEYGRMVQDRNPDLICYLDTPYLHATFLNRASTLGADMAVSKRLKKLKYEIGNAMPLDYFYPEIFFEDKPEYIKSPWSTMNLNYRVRAYIETPLRKIKRKVWVGKPGY